MGDPHAELVERLQAMLEADATDARGICGECHERVEAVSGSPEWRLYPCGHGSTMVCNVEGRLVVVEPDGTVYDATPLDDLTAPAASGAEEDGRG